MFYRMEGTSEMIKAIKKKKRNWTEYKNTVMET